MKKQFLTMQILRWMLLALTLALVSAQRVGPNYGITIRMTPRGLNYAGTAAATDLLNRIRRNGIPDIYDTSGRTSISATNIRIIRMSPPTVTVLPGLPRSYPRATLRVNDIRIEGSVRIRRPIIRRSGTFSITAGNISLTTSVSLSQRLRKPYVSVRTCSANIGTFNFNLNIRGLIGWIIGLFDGRIGRRIKADLQTRLCSEYPRLIPRLNQKLGELSFTTRFQDRSLALDYSLAKDPTSNIFSIDTVVKGDPRWRGRRTGVRTTPRPEQFSFQHFNKMAIFYINDYVLNALGLLLHNDRQIQADITRDKVSISTRRRLALSCTSFFCAGGIFPDLRTRYPDGWLEADLRTTSAPTAVIGSNRVTGNFEGSFVLYVKRPSGSRIRVASGQAKLSAPVALSISGNNIRASVRSSRITVTSATLPIPQVGRGLLIFQTGFIINSLNQLGTAGFPLPSFRGVTFQSPRIEIGNGLIRLVTDLRYTPTSTG